MSAAAFAVYRVAARRATGKAALVVALAVFSHWVLDFVVHRPDLPLYNDSIKVGLGLWNLPLLAFGLEAALLLGGIWLYRGRGGTQRLPMIVFCLAMLAIQAYVFFGPPPASDKAAAATALAAYAAFAALVRLLEGRGLEGRAGPR